jgi:hypothetical protein
LYEEHEIDNLVDKEKAALSDALIKSENFVYPEWQSKIDPKPSNKLFILPSF